MSPALTTMEDNRFKLGHNVGSNLPVEIYDRPGLALSNLMRGNVGGAARSMLDPDTLSPDELKSLTDMIIGREGKEPNPILKAVMDVTTNPLVIIGVTLALLHKAPLASMIACSDYTEGVAYSLGKVQKCPRGMEEAGRCL